MWSLCTSTSQRNPSYAMAQSLALDGYATRHQINVMPQPDIFVSVHTEAGIIGCIGIFRGDTNNPLLTEQWAVNQNRVSNFVRRSTTNRNTLAELGKRVVEPSLSGCSKRIVSQMLITCAIATARRNGIETMLFTTNKSVRKVAESLRIDLCELGTADYSLLSSDTKDDWEKFFGVEQLCFGLSVQQCSSQCEHILRRFRLLFYHFDV